MTSLHARLGLSLALCAALPLSGVARALETIDRPGGEGRIVYGLVGGAATQAAAMGVVLRSVHESCRDRPQVGRVFRVRDTDSVAVFFTVVNRPQGDQRVAGLVIASSPGSGGTEAALVSDDAARFGRTVNPMLTELFRVWHPEGSRTAAAPAGTASPPAATGPSGTAPRLRTVTAADRSASIGLPDGWSLDPASAGGTMMMKGPRGETVALGMGKSGVDPNHPWQRNFARQGGRPLPGQLVCPYRGGLAAAYPSVVQAWRKANGLPPAKLQVEKIEAVAVPPGSPPGEECVWVRGHLDPDGKGLRALFERMCASLPADWGGYFVTRQVTLVPDALVKEDEATVGAIVRSWKLDAEVLRQQAAAAVRQKAQDDAAIRAQTQQAIANIHAVGERARIRNEATQAANDAQHAGYWAQQDSNARRSQSFGNYLLDQTVIQDNDVRGRGTVGHGTVWNSTADALVKSDPRRYEYVTAPDFWKGIDY